MLGGTGEIADEIAIHNKISRITANLGRQIDAKRQGIASSPKPPDLVCCTISHKGNDHILFGIDGGAGVRRGEKTVNEVFIRSSQEFIVIFVVSTAFIVISP